MNDSSPLQHQLISHLQGGEAFVRVEELLKIIPYEALGLKPENLPYSFYEIFYHIWYTQRDIIDYSLSENYILPKWPSDYWPGESTLENEQSWIALQKRYFQERDKFSNYIQSTERDLLAPLENGAKHNLLREIMLVIEHTAYHTGQLVIILRQLGLYGNNQNGK